MATIRIADPIRPSRSNERPDSSGIGSGIYNIRTASLDRRSARSRRGSIDIRNTKTGDAEEAKDEDSGLREVGDYKTKQVRCKSSLYIFKH
jgi:KUP system potassium uptake protein